MLARLWKDIQESWELYAAIGLSVFFFFLGLFGFPNGMIASLTLVVLGILAGSLRRQRGIENKIGKALQAMSQDIHGLVTNQMFDEQEQAYQFLCDWIDKYGAKKAVLFQYSCNTSMSVVRALMRKEAQATVYIQHEDTATKIGSAFQADRIISRVRSLKGDLGRRFSTPDNLKLYKYRSPASVSAIKIDDRVLCMGWYLYEHQAHPHHPDFKNDTTEISAHDVAAIVVFAGTSEYNKLLKTFQALEENFQQHAEEVQF
ncbi:MAG TPA: hypothetical protein VKY19_01815 [Ktedonosporobacter sp.]|jgi:hypothetical protein|nr:hypothetical protein [Ktedonosporobacter sp.]